jgi:hypothetical protein
VTGNVFGGGTFITFGGFVVPVPFPPETAGGLVGVFVGFGAGTGVSVGTDGTGVSVAVGGTGVAVAVDVAVGGTAVFVGVAVDGTAVLVAVGGIGVFVGVAVGGTGVLVGVGNTCTDVPMLVNVTLFAPAPTVTTATPASTLGLSEPVALNVADPPTATLTSA